jgi:hypothetical protein
VRPCDFRDRNRALWLPSYTLFLFNVWGLHFHTSVFVYQSLPTGLTYRYKSGLLRMCFNLVVIKLRLTDRHDGN